MKFTLLLLSIFSLGGYGQNLIFSAQTIDNFRSYSPIIPIDSFKSIKVTSVQRPKERDLGTLAFSEIDSSKQGELHDTLTISKDKNRHYKTRQKQTNTNKLLQIEKANADHVNTNLVQAEIGSILEDTPLNQQLHGFATLTGISDNIVPFWMRSMQYGSVPLNGLSTSTIAGIHKAYDLNLKHKLLDWGAAAEARLNAGSITQVILIEAYVKARMGIFQLKAGRSKDFTGLVDSTLSTGAFAVSGNALGIPKIELSVPEYWELPYTNKLIAMKGTFSHGWFGQESLAPGYLVNHVESYYHQLSLYGRLGKPNWHVNLYGGLNHQVMWGNESKYTKGWGLSSFQEYIYVITGKGYGSVANHIYQTPVGNHLGSIDQGIEISLKGCLVTGYHQFYYDSGALYYLANLKDGIWGISIINSAACNGYFYWKKFLVEFLYSKSQGGEPNSKPRHSGPEDYYNSEYYLKGWSYLDENIGNSLFTSKKHIRSGLPETDWEYIPNDRIMAIHLGSEFTLFQWCCKALLTWSANYGSWFTAPVTRGYGTSIIYNKPPYFPEVNQFSGYFEANRPLKKGYSIGFALAADKGELLNNSVGGFVKITKAW